MSSNGVSPSPSRALGSAPALTRAVTTSGVWLCAAAKCSGVTPASLRALGSAPALMRAVTISGVWLNAAATVAEYCSAVYSPPGSPGRSGACARHGLVGGGVRKRTQGAEGSIAVI